MNDLRRAWGPNAVTRWSVITAALAVVVLALPAGGGGSGFTLPVRLTTALGSAAVGSAILVAAGATWLRPRQHLHRPALAIATFAVAGAATGASRAWLVSAAGADDPLGAAWRITSNTIAAVIWLALTAIVVDHVREHRMAMAELRRKQRELEDLDRREREELDNLAARRRDELLAPARAVLDRIATALAAVQAGRSATEEAARIEEAVATSIRPLSHEMLAADPVVGTAPPRVTPRDRTARLFARASRHVVSSPWIVTLVPVVLSPLLLGPGWGAVFLLVNAVVTWPIYALLLVGLRRVLGPRLQPMSTLAAAITLVTAYAMVTAATIGVTSALGGLSPRPVPYMWVGIVTLTAILLAASLLEAAAELAADDERELRDVLAGIALSLARIQQRLRHEQQVLGALLHGPIQGALLSVAASLEHAPADMADADRQALVGDALERLSEVERRLEAPADDEQSLDEALEGVMMLWKRVMDVDVQLDDDAREALDASPAARGAVSDVLAEAWTNAFRHGGARTAWADITLGPTGACVDVIDDGALDAQTTPGMGSRLYDEAAYEWWLRQRADGRTELHVVIPVAVATTAPQGAGDVAA